MILLLFIMIVNKKNNIEKYFKINNCIFFLIYIQKYYDNS